MYSKLITELQALRSEVTELTIKQNELLAVLGKDEVINLPAEKSITSVDTQGLDQKISLLLHELKIPASIKGYVMVREAVKLVYHDFDMLRAITKELYPAVAMKYNTTPTRVERAIRHAIEVSWIKSNHKLYKSFGFDKPTNAQFIAFLADMFRLEKEVS